ncbi:MAG: efflux transporter outer membrane subunit [Phycisphaerales bacterium]|nr:efflux transporter outer membrane subunit [Phycisphaerales bacterium]
MPRTTAITTAALLALAGCTVGPDHVPPRTQAPTQWPEPLEAGLNAETPDLREWWRNFNDPMLDTLVGRALEGSLDLREAAARVREARAIRGVTAADRLPAVDAGGSGSYTRSSENTFGGQGGGPGEESEFYEVGFDATWELDVFGRVRRAVEAADADIGSAVESRRDARVVLVSEVARNYAEYRSAQARLEIARRNVTSQQDTYTLAQDRLRAGLSGELDSAQSLAQLEETRSRIPVLLTTLKKTAFRLDVLLAQPPGTLMPELEAGAPVPPAPDTIPVGVPAELLRRRPDIRRAERNLAAATARIGVATADLYPRFTLGGSFGLESDHFADLFDTDSRTWSVGPLAVRWPVFDAGRIRSNIRVMEARQEQALIAYERSVLNAYEEVAGALVAYARVREQRESLARAVDAGQRAVELARDLWSRGLTDFLNVLNSQRALYQLQDQLALSDAEATTSLVALYKALGGGWEPPPPEAERAAPPAAGDAPDR